MHRPSNAARLSSLAARTGGRATPADVGVGVFPLARVLRDRLDGGSRPDALGQRGKKRRIPYEAIQRGAQLDGRSGVVEQSSAAVLDVLDVLTSLTRLVIPPMRAPTTGTPAMNAS